MSDSLPTASHSLAAPEQLEGLVDLALSTASRYGASAAEARAAVSTGLSVTVRLGALEKLERKRGHALRLAVFVGKRKGVASTTDCSEDAVRNTARAACEIAQYAAEDDCNGLADPACLAKRIRDLDLDHPWSVTTDEAAQLARQCESAATTFDPHIHNSDGALVESRRARFCYGNSHGFRGGYSTTRHSLSCRAIAEDSGGMQRDYWYSVARDRAELEAPELVGQRAAQRALRRLGASVLETREAPVLFVPELARGLFGHFTAVIAGSALYRKTSFLLGHVGRQVFPDFLSVQELPTVPKGLGSAPFDAEGVATRRRSLISDGVLRGYILDSYSGRRLGLETTGNAGGVHNLVVAPGSLDLEEMLQVMDTGLLVTELMGQGINYVTGNYSRGASGFWVEGGRIRYPVHEITVAGNLLEMYRGILCIGNDVDVRGVIQCGSLLIDRMTIAGR